MNSFFIDAMVFAGSALMAWNVWRYVRFSLRVRERGNWTRERRLFSIPIALLVLFLAGYLAVGFFGHSDIVVAAILFGGSVFVFVMLLMVRRTVDRIQENEQLEAKLTAAEAANRAKAFFLSNMSHDIRTPLNAIIGYTALARREGATEAEKTDCLGKIDVAGRQLLDIVNDVLEMSRIESGRVEIEPVRMNLEDCVREAGDLVKNQLAQKGLRFTVSCEVEHRWVLCDRPLLTRALMNLLCNAGKFTGEGGSVDLSLRELPGDGRTGRYELRVKDTGIGMSPEFVEQLFTPFERERTSTVSRTQGTGLGMAITKNIIDLMGGSIDVETRQGSGTEFTVALDLPIEAGPAGGDARGDAPALPSFDGLRVLLVEDNAVNQEIAQMLLRQAGFDVETAENGQVEVARVADSEPGHFDVILMDVQMPVMDGYAATRAIRALPDARLADIPVIAVTANAFQEDVKAADDAGMDGHIAKPLDVGEMMTTLARVLGRRPGAERTPS